jgi:phenylacetate-coenzyme A ligase PaaK-like adenylate-forming protein
MDRSDSWPIDAGALQRIFGCRVRNSYGVGVLPIAWECPSGCARQHRLGHPRADRRAGRPVPGTRLHRVLTNLANHVQPLIRYDLGDSITLEPEPCACGSGMPALVVEGRQDDALMLPLEREDGSVVPLALSTVLEDDAHVYDFQVTQTEPRTLSSGSAPARACRRGPCGVRSPPISTRSALARSRSVSRGGRRRATVSAASCAG